MRRTLILLILFLLLGGGAWWALRKKAVTTGSANSWDMEFAVKNPNEVSKIFIADRKGNTATLERKEDYWLYNGKDRARPTAVQNLLETIEKVTVWYIPPEAAKENMVKSLATQGIKVEIFGKAGEKLKSYYVGGVTGDERGTFMIMEGSENPYVVHVPSFVGQLRVHYLVGDDQWRDRTVFVEKPEEIQSVTVQYPKQKNESFRLEKTGEAEYTIEPYFSTTPRSKQPRRKGVAEAYLIQFERLGAEAFETNNPLRDSVTALVPFAIVTVKKSNGEEKNVRFWPVEIERRPDTGEEFVTRYFTDYNNGQYFMLTQDRVFGPIFRGYSFFFESERTGKPLAQ